MRVDGVRRSRQARWAEKKQKAGLCRTCGKPREGRSGFFCDAHHEKILYLSRKRYWERSHRPEVHPQALQGGQ